jgi:hypothetical protein
MCIFLDILIYIRGFYNIFCNLFYIYLNVTHQKQLKFGTHVYKKILLSVFTFFL